VSQPAGQPHADPSPMWQHVAAFGDVLRAEWRRAADLQLPTSRQPDHLVIAATGGSAAAGDIVAGLAAATSEIPVCVVRGRQLPNFVGERTLVVAVSCSGNTAETLALYDDAWRRDASLLAITRGGRLAERAADDGIPVWAFTTDAPPRAAVAHILAPLLRILERLGLFVVTTPVVDAAAQLCSRYAAQLAPGIPADRNPVRAAAEAVAGRVPLVLACARLAPVAERARNQLAENAKTLAAAAILPEAAHNIVVGFDAAAAGRWSIVALAAAGDPAAPYLEAVADLAAGRGIPWLPLEVPGSDPFEQVLAGLVAVDALSCHLAMVRGIDPLPIPEIETIRARVAGLPSAEIST